MAEQSEIHTSDTDQPETGQSDTVRLKHLASVNPKKSEISDLPADTEVTFVPLEGFGTNGDIEESEVTSLEEVYQGYTYFREGDIAIAKITPSFENGKGAICEGLENKIAFGTTELHILRPRQGTNPKFLWYVLRAKPFMDEAEAAMRGVAGQKRVPSEFVETYRVPRHSPNQQQAIADFLDRRTARIDALVAKQKRLLDLLDEKRQAFITRAVTKGLDSTVAMKSTEVEWLEEIPEHWNMSKVGWHYEVQLGKMLDEARISGEHLAPYLQNQDVQWWEINTRNLPKMDFTPSEKRKYNLENGDVLVCEGGEIGRSAVWTRQDTECYYQKALHRVRAIDQSQNPLYFCYFMEYAAKNGIFDLRSNQSTISHLTREKLKKQKIPLPPTSEQEQIVSKLNEATERMSELQSKLSSRIELLEEKRQALITAAVTGQIDVTEERGEIQDQSV